MVWLTHGWAVVDVTERKNKPIPVTKTHRRALEGMREDGMLCCAPPSLPDTEIGTRGHKNQSGAEVSGNVDR